ncbi:CCDC81 eukaryotic HU domain 1 [Phytophthora infestans]|uniref:CCDC81 eukaryotic HU domain 1 n=1 Tax=Phytophthora infestans TaxID=4787 RepID=A0A833WR32_PHYIN|nr:CCDC81 eukaryotic HU domain 1 [Phytophthora infestans]KAF4127297.1 CCDC81 eukaryotic HU domain 1 [Phytophthora infestans]KAF4130764.1 CCDC81 eukaryotic HU domain 1 [Phytophthora infestans]
MRISEFSHHLKKTSLWDNDNQADPEAEQTTADILAKATATIRASLGVNNPEDIWKALGLYLRKQLMYHNAVGITDFGAFGFSESNEPVFVQDPVFLHMTRLCLASRKRGDLIQPTLPEDEDVASIEMSELAANYLQNCSKELVKTVISSVLAWVVAWAKDGQEMRLSFLPVGEWICDGNSVDFEFADTFRKELKRRRLMKDRAKSPELSNDDIHSDSNQTEDQDQVGHDLSDFHSALTDTTKLSSQPLKGKAHSTVKEAPVRNGSPVVRSLYKLCQPTSSSIAKQLPPHGQRRSRTESLAKGPNNRPAPKKQTAYGRKSAANRVSFNKQTPSTSSKIDPADIEAAAKEIVDAMRNSRPTTASSSRTCRTNQSGKTASQPTTQQMDTIDRLRKRLSRSKVVQGLNALVAVLNPIKTSAVSSTELSLSLRKLGVKVSSAELKELATAFAHEKRGYVDTRKLLDALRGHPLSGERLEVVARVFHQLDQECSGSVHIDDLVKHYEVGFLPQVRDGKQSRLEALTEFLHEWACVNSTATDNITFETFAEYYHNVSACIDNDADFERLMREAWHVPERTSNQDDQSRMEHSNNVPATTFDMTSGDYLAPPLSDENEWDNTEGVKMKLREETSPDEVWSYLRTQLLFPQNYEDGARRWPTLDNMCRRLGANRVMGDGNESMNIKAFAQALVLLDKRLPFKKAYDLARFVAAHCCNELGDSETIVLQSLYRQIRTNPNEVAAKELSVANNYIEYYASRAIERIRARVKGFRLNDDKADSSSLVDFATLEKWLQASSSTGDRLLLKYELRSALLKVGIDVTYHDLDYLFAYFDVERQGFINYELFLDTLRLSSGVLPKLAKRLEKRETIQEQTHENFPANGQPSIALVSAASAPPVRRRKQLTPREPQLNYRRRNVIHRAIYDQTTRPAFTESLNFNFLGIERRRRDYAAQLIQTVFRGFRARRIVSRLRLKVAARNCRFNMMAQEQQQWLGNKKLHRTALPTAYGF